MPKRKAPKRVRKQAGKGFLDSLLKNATQAASIAKEVSKATGIKPSSFVKNKTAKGLLRSQGLGKKPRKRGPRKPKQVGDGFFSSLASGFKKGFLTPFQLINVAKDAVGGSKGGAFGVSKHGGGNGKSGMNVTTANRGAITSGGKRGGNKQSDTTANRGSKPKF